MLEGRCDLCLQKDGFKGHNLQECKSCGVKVHETCYGLPWTKTKRADFECAACAYAENGARERPTECQLCSVSEGVHAMHPLYDRDGPEGKPVLVSSGKDGATRRPAFVHTLCGMYLASWAGVVYGCDVDGNFEGGDVDDDDDDDDDQEEETEETEMEEDDAVKEGANPTNKATPPAQSTDAGSASEDKEKEANVSSSTTTDGTNKENVKEEKKDDEKKDEDKDDDKDEDKDDDDDDDDKTAELMPTHHFVICGREKGKETAWTRHTKELRDNVKCKICGKSDKKTGILRIPVQCSWGDKNELKEFKERHPKSAASEVCNEGMHVGCARWGRAGRLDGQPSLPKQVFFYAGQAPEKDGGTFTDPVSNAYCRRHAQLLHDNRPRAAGDDVATATATATEKSRGKTSATTTTPTPTAASVLEALPATTCLATPTVVVVDKDKEEADRKREARRSELAARQRRQLAQIEARKRREQEQRDRDLDDRRRQEQKKKEFESRKRALVSKMSAELKRILLDLLAKRSERKVIVEAKRSCRMRWSKEANFSMDTFRTLWSKVEDIVQEATVKEVEAWKKNKAAVSKETRTAVALAAAARSKMVATKPAVAAAAEQPKRLVETKSKPRSQAVAPAVAVTVAAEKPVDKDDEVEEEVEAEAEAEAEAAKKKEETPWDYLWIPNYNGVGFKFDKWDTYERIDTI